MTKILIVDDDLVLQNLYRSAFEHEGYEVEVASNGEEGYEKVKSFVPDVVVTDVMMPKIDGIELLKKIKSDKSARKVPVVVMSNLANEEDVQRALAEGAAKHISKKDSKPGEIVDAVKSVL